MGNIFSRIKSLSVAEKPSKHPYLPEGLVVEIISWLPPESLIRFKCVCKSWHALIRDPKFIAKHLHNVNNMSSSSSLMFGYVYPSNRVSLLTIFGYEDDENDSIRFVTKALNLPPNDSARKIASLYHCDGIICVSCVDQSIVLSNPAINEFRVLPELFFANSFPMMGMGFGYDRRAKDYKVVRFGFINWSNPEGRRAEVYSLATDSWKEIEMKIQINGYFSGNEVYCNGVYYWRVADHNHKIVSFDMGDEVFHDIPLPNNLQALVIEPDNIQLAVWKESVAFIHFPGDSEDPIFIEVFVMNDRSDGARSSCYWVRHLKINPFEGIVSPWTFWMNDELLMVRDNTDEWLVSYNLRSKRIRNIPVLGQPGMYFGFLYVASLVSVKRREQAHLQI